MKTNSPNPLQTCSQGLKAHVVFVEWVFWHIIKVNIKQVKVLDSAFKAMHQTKIPCKVYRDQGRISGHA